jgi:hypothetical protein
MKTEPLKLSDLKLVKRVLTFNMNGIRIEANSTNEAEIKYKQVTGLDYVYDKRLCNLPIKQV